MAMKVVYFSGHKVESPHMANRIRLELAVPAEVRKDGDHFVSFCPALDVYSQGPGEEAALDNLAEALQLFVESCLVGRLSGCASRMAAIGVRVV